MPHHFFVFLLVCACTISSSFAWAPVNWRRLAAATALATALPILPANAGNDALAAAQRAMMEKKDRQVRVKSFDELNPSAKKRFALDRCKERDALKQGGYKSSADCTAAVLSGDYTTIVGGREPEPRVVFDSSRDDKASVRPASAELVAAPPPKVAKSPVKPPANTPGNKGQTKREKKTDLSDVSSAGLRRRALAACKKSSIRNEAKMGSESRCTERVLGGDVAPIIEVLEYQ